MEDMKKDIQDVISSLAKGIEAENEEINRDAVISILKSLSDSPYDFTNPDIFNTMFMFPLEQLLELVAKNLHEEKDPVVKDEYKPQFIFIHYSFLKYNIEKLIEKKRKTSSCVADVSRTILSMYLKYSLTGVIPETNLEEHYWLPKFGTNEEWIVFCDSLCQLYYGNNEDYLKAYMVLLNSEIRKYPHTRYSLVAKFKDGTSGVVEEKYDKDTFENPELVEGYYNIPKSAFSKKMAYDNANNLRGFLNRFFYKVPKEDIVGFEVIKEDVMI